MSASAHTSDESRNIPPQLVVRSGIGGMLIGLDTSIDPLTGFRVILPIFAAAVVGGLGSIPGAVVGVAGDRPDDAAALDPVEALRNE